MFADLAARGHHAILTRCVCDMNCLIIWTGVRICPQSHLDASKHADASSRSQELEPLTAGPDPRTFRYVYVADPTVQDNFKVRLSSTGARSFTNIATSQPHCHHLKHAGHVPPRRPGVEGHQHVRCAAAGRHHGLDAQVPPSSTARLAPWSPAPLPALRARSLRLPAPTSPSTPAPPPPRLSPSSLRCLATRRSASWCALHRYRARCQPAIVWPRKQIATSSHSRAPEPQNERAVTRLPGPGFFDRRHPGVAVRVRAPRQCGRCVFDGAGARLWLSKRPPLD